MLLSVLIIRVLDIWVYRAIYNKFVLPLRGCRQMHACKFCYWLHEHIASSVIGYMSWSNIAKQVNARVDPNIIMFCCLSQVLLSGTWADLILLAHITPVAVSVLIYWSTCHWELPQVCGMRCFGSWDHCGLNFRLSKLFAIVIYIAVSPL